MSKRKCYRFDLHCPHCRRDSQVVMAHEQPAPKVRCGDCLWNERLVIELDVVAVVEVVL